MNKKAYIIIGSILATILIIILALIIWYQIGIGAPASGQKIETEVDIKTGTSTVEILKLLKEKGVIKNISAAEIYIKLHNVNNLQAGKYLLSSSNKLADVLNKIRAGEIMDETVTITFKEGRNMRYVASTIAENTNNSTNDVYEVLKDNEYILSLINKYWFLSTDVQDKNIYYSLEGYLYPDTYTFENADVDVKTIFERMLDQTGKVLAKYKTDRNNENENENVITDHQNRYSAHEVLTMASIVELEGNTPEDRAKIARVIYNRVAHKMSLGSDVTTYYAIRVDVGSRDLSSREISTYNAYNTRGPNMEGKLPVGPIANPSEESIKAVLHPVDGDYLYFVADKNGDMYFTNTYEEHQEMINTLKKKGLWYEY